MFLYCLKGYIVQVIIFYNIFQCMFKNVIIYEYYPKNEFKQICVYLIW